MFNIKRLFFFPPLQLQVKSNDFGYRLSSLLSRLWDVYNPGRQKFIAPTLLLMSVFNVGFHRAHGRSFDSKQVAKQL